MITWVWCLKSKLVKCTAGTILRASLISCSWWCWRSMCLCPHRYLIQSVERMFTSHIHSWMLMMSDIQFVCLVGDFASRSCCVVYFEHFNSIMCWCLWVCLGWMILCLIRVSECLGWFWYDYISLSSEFRNSCFSCYWRWFLDVWYCVEGQFECWVWVLFWCGTFLLALV